MNERFGFYQRPERRRVEEWGGLAIGMALAATVRLLVGVPSFAYALIAIGGMVIVKMANNRLLARSGGAEIPISQLNQRYLAESAVRPAISIILETGLMMAVVIGGILALALPISSLTGDDLSLVAVVPVVGVISGFSRVYRVRRAAAMSASPVDTSGPQGSATPNGGIWKEYWKSLPVTYAGALLGTIVGALVGLRVPGPFAVPAFLVSFLLGVSVAGIGLPRRPLRPLASAPTAVQRFMLTLMIGVLSWGVPMGIFFSGFVVLECAAIVPQRPWLANWHLATLIGGVVAIALVGGAMFGAFMWALSEVISLSMPRSRSGRDENTG